MIVLCSGESPSGRGCSWVASGKLMSMDCGMYRKKWGPIDGSGFQVGSLGSSLSPTNTPRELFARPNCAAIFLFSDTGQPLHTMSMPEVYFVCE